MPGANTTRLPFWAVWPHALLELASPIMLAGVGIFIVHLVRIGFGSMFDDDHIGSTVVGFVAAVIAAVFGGLGTQKLVATLRATVLHGPCPCCGAIAARRFESLTDRWSPSTACGVCIAYVRRDGLEMREVALETFEMIGRPYTLHSDQYLRAVKHTNRNYFKFEMPAMCSVCGDPDAPFMRDIGDGDAFGTSLDGFWSQQNHVLPGAGMGPSAPTVDDENSRGLSQLRTPVCAKHTKDAEVFGEALEYARGKLEFASYRYYKAFCESNDIRSGHGAGVARARTVKR